MTARYPDTTPPETPDISARLPEPRAHSDSYPHRYRNVLRVKKETIQTIAQSKLLLTGGIDVSADKSANMPKYIMDDISDAMKGKLPDEFRDVLEQYYRRLSEQPNK